MSLASTHLRLPLVALGAAAFASLAPLAPATAATVVHHPAHAVHRHVAHGYAGHHAHHYAYRHGRRYAGYGYNPGMAVVGAALGLGAAAAYPYGCDPYSYGPWGSNACADTSDWGGYYGPAYGGFGYGYGPGYYGGGHYGHRSGYAHGFQGGAPGSRAEPSAIWAEWAEPAWGELAEAAWAASAAIWAAVTSPAELASKRYGYGRLSGPPERVQRNHFA